MTKDANLKPSAACSRRRSISREEALSRAKLEPALSPSVPVLKLPGERRVPQPVALNQNRDEHRGVDDEHACSSTRMRPAKCPPGAPAAHSRCARLCGRGA